MSKPQKAVWTQVCKMLGEVGVLTVIDGAQIERYVVALCRWRQLERVIARLSETDNMLAAMILNEDKRPALKLAFAEAARLSVLLSGTEAQFGMTPSGRARLVVPPSAAEEDEIESRYFA